MSFQSKQYWRHTIKSKVAHYPFYKEDSEKITQYVEESAEFQSAKNILLFAPLKDEVDIFPIFLNNVQKKDMYKKNLFFPRVIGKDIQIYQVNTLNDFEEGSFGIREPKQSLETGDIHLLDLVIVPAIGFDEQKNRLGRGQGYYDRFLSTLKSLNKQVVCMGVCFPFQMILSIPTEPHDIPMDTLITLQTSSQQLRRL